MEKSEIEALYRNELKNKYESFKVPEGHEWGDEECHESRTKYIDSERKRIHEQAMKGIDEILSPELKVFIRNFCYNKLWYPDEPIFYEAFGDFPKKGYKVSKERLIQNGVDLKEFERLMSEVWVWEGNIVREEEIAGKTYYKITALNERTFDLEKEILAKSIRGSLDRINLFDRMPEDLKKFVRSLSDI